MNIDMVHRNTWILRVSCLLSIIGSIIVMIACSYPKRMWKKKGRQLIFWLSVSDLATSIVYFFSSFENGDNNSKLCQTTALLGIFFPVASFLWTDFIGYYLYTMISTRKLTTENEWNILMRWFHIISWGIAGICIAFVAAFDHAGRNQSDNNSENTGGWCWIVTSKYSNLIYWEIIGGKFVEWISCFIILPYLYYSTAKTLILLDHSSVSSQQLNIAADRTKPLLNSTSTTITSLSTSTSSISDLRATSLLSPQQDSFKNPKFQKFYIKMAIVPILFFFCRFWGSLRIFLYLLYPPSSSTSAAENAHHAADTWLYLMQAIFDPVQGFFNAILFVFLSESDRQNIYYLFWTLPINSLMGRETQPLPRASSPGHSSPSFSSKTKKKFSFFHRFTSLFSSSSSFSTSLLPPDTPHGRERAPQSSSHRSDGYSSHYYRDGANDSENDHVGLSRISESGTTMRDSEVYVNSQHRIRDASFVYENDSVSEYSVN